MALWRMLVLLVFSATLRGAKSQFSTPPDSSNSSVQLPVYTVGQPLNISWRTNITSGDLLMWQVNNDTLWDLQCK
jgi:hypothetical protein